MLIERESNEITNGLIRGGNIIQKIWISEV